MTATLYQGGLAIPFHRHDPQTLFSLQGERFTIQWPCGLALRYTLVQNKLHPVALVADGLTHPDLLTDYNGNDTLS